jgi:hypothetical protein
MRTAIVTAAFALVLGASAYAGSTPATHLWHSKMKAVPVSTATCAGEAAKYQTALKVHAKSPHLAKAEADAAAGKTACAAGKTADGIADYQSAIKLLGA